MNLAVSKNRIAGRSLPGMTLLFCLGWLLFEANPGHAQEVAPPPSHFVFVVTSQFQRDMIPSGADLMVFVDTTNGLSKEGPFDVQALHLPALRKKLEPLAKGNPHVQFNLFCPQGARPLQTEKAGKELTDLGKQIGFKKSTTYWTHFNDDTAWVKYSKQLTKKSDEIEDQETPLADGVVRLYSVKTSLSRFLTSNADWVADLPPLGQNDKTIPENVVNSIKKVFKDQKIKPNSKLLFRQQHPDEDKYQTVIKDLFKIGEELGFNKNVSVTNY